MKEIYSSADIQGVCNVSRQRLNVLKQGLKENIDYIVVGVNQIVYKKSAITKIKLKQKSNKKYRNKL